MKKILLASTILVGTAGLAAADIAFSGEAYVGIARSTAGTFGVEASASMDVAMSGETDGGLAFGADFTVTAGGYGLNAAENGFAGSAGGVGDATVWMSGSWGKVSAEVDSGTPEVTIGYEASFGSIDLEASYLALAGTYSVMATYNFGNYEVHAAVNGAPTTFDLGASATFGNIEVGGDVQDVTGARTWDIFADYSTGAYSFGGTYDSTGAYGVSAGYDLGGGASIDASYASTGVAKLGVSMEF